MSHCMTIKKNSIAAKSIINQAKDVVFYGVNTMRSGTEATKDEFLADIENYKGWKLQQRENSDGMYYTVTLHTGAYYKFTI